VLIYRGGCAITSATSAAYKYGRFAAPRDNVDTGKFSGNSRHLKDGIGEGTPTQTGSDMNFPVVKLIEIFSPDDWEAFT
jgi:hypothetical protein